jgi:hypothetical protein
MKIRVFYDEKMKKKHKSFTGLRAKKKLCINTINISKTLHIHLS